MKGLLDRANWIDDQSTVKRVRRDMVYDREKG